VALRAGDTLRLPAGGRVLARGGSVPSNTTGAVSPSVPAPAGAGSGGSIVVQGGTAANVSLLGLMDVRGGNGGDFNRAAGGTPVGTPPAGAVVIIEGGDGAPGFVRLEVPGTPTTAALPNTQPPAATDNVAPLAEIDNNVMCRSKFYLTDASLPEYVRYEVYAVVDGAPVVFSDDPAISSQTASGELAAVRALFQSGRIDVATGDVLQTGPWRQSVRSSVAQTGIASDAFNGFRFQIVINRAVTGTVPANITIDRVVVVYRS
jgi:hypothetical protein